MSDGGPENAGAAASTEDAGAAKRQGGGELRWSRGCVVAVLACLGFLAAWGLASTWLENLLNRATFGSEPPDLLVLDRPDGGALVYISVLTLIATFVAMNVKSKTRAILQALAAFSVGAFWLYTELYAGFVGMRPEGAEVELVYTWPRPGRRLDPRGGSVYIHRRGTETGDFYQVVLQVEASTYESSKSTADSDAREAVKLLKARGVRDRGYDLPWAGPNP